MFRVNANAKTFGLRIEQVQQHQILVRSDYLECLYKHKTVTKLDIRFLNPSKTFDKQIAALGRVPTSKIFPDPKVRPVDEVVTDVQFRNTNVKNNPEQKIAVENIIKRYSAC